MPVVRTSPQSAACATVLPDPLQLDQQLCFALYAASNRVQRRYRPLLEPLGLTYPQYLVMLVLWQHGQRSVGELGAALHLDSGTLTPLLKRLEAAGLLRRQRCSADERRVLVDLTEPGQALRARAIELPQRMLCMTGLDPQQLLRLRDELRVMLQSLAP